MQQAMRQLPQRTRRRIRFKKTRTRRTRRKNRQKDKGGKATNNKAVKKK